MSESQIISFKLYDITENYSMTKFSQIPLTDSEQEQAEGEFAHGIYPYKNNNVAGKCSGSEMTNFLGDKQIKWYATGSPNTEEQLNDYLKFLFDRNIQLVLIIGKQKQWFGFSNGIKHANYTITPKKTFTKYGIKLTRYSISDEENSKDVTIVIFPNWEDGDVPSFKSMFAYCKLIIDCRSEIIAKYEELPFGCDAGISINCKAGVGRTGVFYCCLYKWLTGINEYNTEKLILKLRKYRPYMIQTDCQVKFIEQIMRNLYDLSEH